MNILEINDKLCCQLEASQEQFQDLKEKFLLSEALHIPLANEMWKYC
jgi:hypothetical protein